MSLMILWQTSDNSSNSSTSSNSRNSSNSSNSRMVVVIFVLFEEMRTGCCCPAAGSTPHLFLEPCQRGRVLALALAVFQLAGEAHYLSMLNTECTRHAELPY